MLVTRCLFHFSIFNDVSDPVDRYVQETANNFFEFLVQLVRLTRGLRPVDDKPDWKIFPFAFRGSIAMGSTPFFSLRYTPTQCSAHWPSRPSVPDCQTRGQVCPTGQRDARD